MTEWIAYCAPGHRAEVAIAVAMGLGSEHGRIIDVQESQIVEHPTVILVADGLAIFRLAEQVVQMPVEIDRDRDPYTSRRWPDGEAITPWADPWHNIAGDVRAMMHGAFEHREDPEWPLPDWYPGSDDEQDNDR